MAGGGGAPRRGGVGRLVAAVAFLAACAAYAALVALGVVPGWRALLERDPGQEAPSSSEPAGEAPADAEGEAGGVDPGDPSSYGWEDLAAISRMVEEAGEDGGLEVARRYGLVEADGSLAPATWRLALSDGTTCQVRLVGVLHDERADGGGRAGLTFCLSTLAMRPMNDTQTTDGGWEGSGLRSWLSTEGMALLPDDLRGLVVPVTKLTNNVGVTSDEASVTATADSLWLFSAHEVAGDVDWFWHEFGDGRGVGGYAYLDDLLNLEGSQYQGFAEAGVSSREAPDGVLAATWAGAPCAWWYRSAYPFDFAQTGEGYFFQVMASGYPDSIGRADESAGVVCGFCL